MKIINLEISGTLGINAKFRNFENMVTLAGRNGAGKSRVIDCILSALKYESVPPQVKEALQETEGVTTIEIGDKEPKWIIKRTHKNKTTKLQITDSSGMIGNKKIIDSFIGEFVNIGEIVTMGKKKLEQVVMRMLGIEDSLKELNEEVRDLMYERKIKKREEQKQEPGEEPEKVGRVDISTIMKELEVAQKTNETIDRDKKEIIKYVELEAVKTREIQEAEKQIIGLEKKISDAKHKRRSIEETKKVTEKRISTSQAVDLAPIRDRGNSATQTNNLADKWETWERDFRVHKEIKDKVAKLTVAIAGKREEISSIISKKSEKIGITGLSFDDGLRLNGNKLLSDGEIRKIAFTIAKNTRKDFSIAMFENFSLLDIENQNEIVKEVEEAGFQLFAEVVRSQPTGDKNEFFIQDGELTNE